MNKVEVNATINYYRPTLKEALIVAEFIDIVREITNDNADAVAYSELGEEEKRDLNPRRVDLTTTIRLNHKKALKLVAVLESAGFEGTVDARDGQVYAFDGKKYVRKDGQLVEVE